MTLKPSRSLCQRILLAKRKYVWCLLINVCAGQPSHNMNIHESSWWASYCHISDGCIQIKHLFYNDRIRGIPSNTGIRNLMTNTTYWKKGWWMSNDAVFYYFVMFHFFISFIWAIIHLLYHAILLFCGNEGGSNLTAGSAFRGNTSSAADSVWCDDRKQFLWCAFESLNSPVRFLLHCIDMNIVAL